MRPRTIAAFEWLYVGSLAIAFLRIVVASQQVGAGRLQFAAAVIFFALALNLTLVFFVSQRRSPIAKWLLVGLFLIGCGAYLPILQRGIYAVSVLIDIGLGLMQAVAIGLLFMPSARTWLKAGGRGPHPSGVLERTFE